MNAKLELLEHLGSADNVLCAKILYEEDYFNPQHINLKIGFSNEDLEKFLNELDFEYDDGYGRQFLHGTIWMKDNTWHERAEYDGSEWWRHVQVPSIPDELVTINTLQIAEPVLSGIEYSLGDGSTVNFKTHHDNEKDFVSNSVSA